MIYKNIWFYFNGVKNWTSIRNKMKFDLLHHKDKSVMATSSPFLSKAAVAVINTSSSSLASTTYLYAVYYVSYRPDPLIIIVNKE